jgi:c-di-GMP-binding flagellar brake protein YcgR
MSESDRRKYSRIHTGQVISVAPTERPDRLAVSKNVSMGGMRFEVVGCEIELDTVIRVTFNVGHNTLIAVGRVAWATEVDPITTDVGLEFIEIDPLAQRLLEGETLVEVA